MLFIVGKTFVCQSNTRALFVGTLSILIRDALSAPCSCGLTLDFYEIKYPSGVCVCVHPTTYISAKYEIIVFRNIRCT